MPSWQRQILVADEQERGNDRRAQGCPDEPDKLETA